MGCWHVCYILTLSEVWLYEIVLNYPWKMHAGIWSGHSGVLTAMFSQMWSYFWGIFLMKAARLQTLTTDVLIIASRISLRHLLMSRLDLFLFSWSAHVGQAWHYLSEVWNDLTRKCYISKQIPITSNFSSLPIGQSLSVSPVGFCDAHLNTFSQCTTFCCQHIYLPGDNDVGGEGFDIKEQWKVKRFNSYFQHTDSRSLAVINYKFLDFLRVGISFICGWQIICTMLV